MAWQGRACDEDHSAKSFGGYASREVHTPHVVGNAQGVKFTASREVHTPHLTTLQNPQEIRVRTSTHVRQSPRVTRYYLGLEAVLAEAPSAALVFARDHTARPELYVLAEVTVLVVLLIIPLL